VNLREVFPLTPSFPFAHHFIPPGSPNEVWELTGHADAREIERLCNFYDRNWCHEIMLRHEGQSTICRLYTPLSTVMQAENHATWECRVRPIPINETLDRLFRDLGWHLSEIEAQGKEKMAIDDLKDLFFVRARKLTSPVLLIGKDGARIGRQNQKGHRLKGNFVGWIIQLMHRRISPLKSANGTARLVLGRRRRGQDSPSTKGKKARR